MTFDFRSERGGFDIIGDVHGCADELIVLLGQLGYGVDLDRNGPCISSAPRGRRLVFVGDLVDRGPRSPDVLRLVMSAVRRSLAMAVVGNHDDKFWRWLKGNSVKISHGLETTVEQMERESSVFRDDVRTFIGSLPTYVWLDGGDLVVAHAGIEASMIGRMGGAVRRFCIYGDTDGHLDANGLSIRYNWAARYSGRSIVVYGHVPVLDVVGLNNTFCIDTGCCFGGKLSALRWPEREVVAVPALAAYATRARPFGLPPPRP